MDMKKIACIAAVLLLSFVVVAQEPKALDFLRTDSVRMKGYRLPDSLSYLMPWKHEYRRLPEAKDKPVVSMTSIVAIPWENMPSRITVLNNNTLRLGRHFTISNGQAWNWSPFPDAYLDARTLSFPMPR